jgi:CRP-like cAMP-binding protein
MIQRLYQAGEILFEEGEPSDFTCRILAGTAEIVKRHRGEDVILGTAEVGDFAGEMGVIQGGPRIAMVRAATDLSVEIYPKDEFLTRISEDKQLAFRLLVRLSERLKILSQAFAEAVIRSDPLREKSVPKSDSSSPMRSLRLCADSDHMAGVLPAEGLPVHALPFSVGRLSMSVTAQQAFPVDLAIEDTQPYRLSRIHFSIETANGGFIVRDMHSSLGTDVNGQGLGDQFTADRAPLNAGDNLIVAGGHGSPYRFRLLLEG